MSSLVMVGQAAYTKLGAAGRKKSRGFAIPQDDVRTYLPRIDNLYFSATLLDPKL